MKTILTLIILFLWGSTSSLNAQNQNRSATIPGVQQLITQYSDQLNLTDQQKADLVELQTERRANWRLDGVRGVNRRGQMSGQRRGFNQRGMVRGDRRSGRQGARGAGIAGGDLETRWESYAEYQDEIRDILTSEQIEQLKSIRLDRIENQYEFRALRHNAMIERAELDSEKAAEVSAALNRINELQKEMQVQRVENPEEFDREAMLQVMDEIRNIHVDLRNTLTVAEYQQLQPGFRAVIGQRGSQRPSGRMFNRRR